MSQIAGLQDFRGQGTPKDRGAFVQPCTVNVFLDAGIYYGVSWSGGVLVGSNANLRTVVVAAQTYLAGLGGGSIFLSLIGTHVFAPTLVVTVNGISFFGLGKSTVLTVNIAAPVSFFEVQANDVTFQNIAFNAQVGAYVDPSELDGITVQAGSHRTLLIQLYFYNWPPLHDHPCEVKTTGVQREVVVAECNFYNCQSFSVAFASPAGGHCIATGCTCVDSGGFELSLGSFNFVVGCTFRGGIGLSSTSILYDLNFVIGCSFEGTEAIWIVGTVGVPINNCAIIGCTLSACNTGIYVQYANDALISSNTITASIGTQFGVQVALNVNRAAIIGNRINCVTGVSISGVTAVDTIMFDNNLNGCADPVLLGAGATVIVPTLVLPFTVGGNAAGVQVAQFISAAGAAKGWEIDEADEWAIAYGQLPRIVLRVLYIKVWAVGLAAPAAGNQMLLDFTWRGGGSDASYNTYDEAYANKESVETAFAVNDVISWAATTTWSINQLKGGYSIEVKAIYNAAVAPDIATDAVFRCVEIMYV